MNPDLLMGDELLKKTRAGNLFMVFGEPDNGTRKTRDSKLQVEIRGVDVYDPTTQEIRSNSTDDIACARSGPTSTKLPGPRSTRPAAAPSPPPQTGKIAVKVINHYGDEVLKVFAVSG